MLATLEITPAASRNGLSLEATSGHSEPVEAIRVHVVDLAAAPKEEVERWRKSVLTGSTPSARNETKPLAITLNGNLNANVRSHDDDQRVIRRGLAHLNFILHNLERGVDVRACLSCQRIDL